MSDHEPEGIGGAIAVLFQAASLLIALFLIVKFIKWAWSF